jgi:hypothetical protein
MLIGPGSTLIENPLELASLYLGGAVTGIGYVLGIVTGRQSEIGWRPESHARWLLIFTVAWTALLALRPLHWKPSPLPWDFAWVWAPSSLGVVLIVLASFAWMALRRQAFRAAATCAGLASLVALGNSLLVQIVLR